MDGSRKDAENALKKFRMDQANSVSVPADPNTKLAQSSESDQEVDVKLYQSAVGSLTYLAIATCPDITFVMNRAAQYCSKPSTPHWNYVKKTMWYLLGTKELGLCYKVTSDANPVGYTDVDFAGDSETS